MELLFGILESIHATPLGLRDRLSSFLVRQEVKKNEFLLKEGQISSKLYFIEQGLTRGYHIYEGQEVTSWFMTGGDFIFSVDSFYERIASFEYIIAIEASIVWYITYDQLQQLYREFPPYNLHGRVITELYYVRSMRRARNLIKKTATQRYQLLLEKEPYLLERAKLSDIASYLGMTPVMLSKVRAQKYGKK